MFSCRKADITLKPDVKASTAAFFKLTGVTDKEIIKVANDLKKQDSILHFLPAFINKNGVPRWDKVFYKVQKNKSQAFARRAGRETADTSTGQGMFFIPLQSTTGNDIKAYVTCYKHNDSLYTYKLFNKDSLNNIHPTVDSAKTNLLNAQAVFGFFEKNINGVDSVLIGSPHKAYIKGATMQFKDSASNVAGREFVVPSGSGCSYTMVVTETYIYLEVYENGILAMTYHNYYVNVAVSVFCTGDETPPPGGGGGSSGYNWYNYGTGGYFNTTSPVNGQYWWTRTLDGGGGDGTGNSPQVPTFSDYAVPPFNWTFSGDDGTNFLDIDPSEEPDFQFNPVDDYESKYPRFTNMVKNLKTFVKNNQKVLNALQAYSGFSKQQILDQLTYGNGPTIKVEEMEGRFGFYNKKNGVNTLHVRASYVRGLENSFLNSTQEGTAFLLAVTLLHEYIHLGTSQNNISEGVYDFGYGFERDAFNVIVDDDNAGEVVIKFSQYF